MCSEFHKALRNKTSDEIMKATEARSIENLSTLMHGQKISEFMDNVRENLDERTSHSKSPKRRMTKILSNTITLEDQLEL